MPKKRFVFVTERAVLLRVNRKLNSCGERLKRRRYDARRFDDTGRFYLIDVDRNFLVSADVDLEAFARELGALKPYEKITDEE